MYSREIKTLKRVTWYDHSPFTDSLSSTGWAMINMHTKFEVYVHLIWRYEIQQKCTNLGNLVWVVRGHPRSSAMSPFDRLRLLFNLNRNYASIAYHLRVICRKLPLYTYPTWTGHHEGWPHSNFVETFGTRKPESLSYRVLFVWSYV